MRYILAWLALCLLVLLPAGCMLDDIQAPQAIGAPQNTQAPNAYIAADNASTQAASAAGTLTAAQGAISATQDAIKMAEAQAKRAEIERQAQIDRATMQAGQLYAQATMNAQSTALALDVRASEIALQEQYAEATRNQDAHNATVAQATKSAWNEMQRASETKAAQEAAAALGVAPTAAAMQRRIDHDNRVAAISDSLCFLFPFGAMVVFLLSAKLAFGYLSAKVERQRIDNSFRRVNGQIINIYKLPGGQYANRAPDAQISQAQPGIVYQDDDSDILEAEPILSPNKVTITAPMPKRAPWSKERKAAYGVLLATVKNPNYGGNSKYIIAGNAFPSRAQWQIGVDALKAAGAVVADSKGTAIVEEYAIAENLLDDIETGALQLPYPASASPVAPNAAPGMAGIG